MPRSTPKSLLDTLSVREDTPDMDLIMRAMGFEAQSGSNEYNPVFKSYVPDRVPPASGERSKHRSAVS